MMMRFNRMCLMMAGMIWVGAERPLFAVEAVLRGHYRVEADALFELDTHRAGAGDLTPTQAYWKQRLRLEPSLFVSPQVTVHSQLDLLDNVLAGESNEGQQNIYADRPDQLGTISTGIGPFESLNVRRAWIEATLPRGRLLAGRMGTHWGLGIVENSGDTTEALFGDTVDRLGFEWQLGPMSLMPAIDKLREATRDPALPNTPFGELEPGGASNAGDLTRYSLRLFHDGELHGYGLLFTWSRQHATNTDLFLEDFFARVTIAPVTLWAEFAFTQGSTDFYAMLDPQHPYFSATPVDTSQNAYHFRAEIDFGKRLIDSMVFDIGYASGDRQTIPFNGFRYSRDFDLALLLFNMPLGVDRNDNSLVATPNFVTNAHYFRALINLPPINKMALCFNLLHALTAERISGKNSYGWEVDLFGRVPIASQLWASLGGGVLFPGAIFDLAGETADPAYGLRGSLTTTW